MTLLRRLFVLAACAAAVALAYAPVRAGTETVRGVVLSVNAESGEAIVRHEPFGGMPSMSMPFRILPRTRAAELLPGVQIEAQADRSTEPWSLRDVRVIATEALTAAPVRRSVTLLHLGDTVPDTPFVDQAGRPFRFSQLRGSDVVLAFVYTRCRDPQMCPLISSKFHALQETAGTRRLHLVAISIDPSFDRPPVLARYARTFGADPARWTIAVGDAAATLDFAARFGIGVFPDPDAGLIHSENTVEIDAAGRIFAMLPDTSWQPAELLADVDAAEGAGLSPLARVDRWLARSAVALCGSAVLGVSGIADLGALVAIFAALAYLIVRLARGIFAGSGS